MPKLNVPSRIFHTLAAPVSQYGAGADRCRSGNTKLIPAHFQPVNLIWKAKALKKDVAILTVHRNDLKRSRPARLIQSVDDLLLTDLRAQVVDVLFIAISGEN